MNDTIKTIPSREVLLAMLEYDSQTGVLRWRVRSARNVPVGSVAGSANNGGYWRVRIHGVDYMAHQIIWMMVTGEQPPEQIDHRDGDRANNAWKNLRASTHVGNHQNQGINSNNKSGFTGVSAYREKWRAHIRPGNGGQAYIGIFDTPELAAAAYRAAKRRLHKFQPEQRTTNLRPHNRAGVTP